ncbi:MAG: hypothetical protein JWO94_243 [Verrucomicrobiaceae bacterium]|nr:hypothetical protein [Verrucomicrobiaceae bacterium]
MRQEFEASALKATVSLNEYYDRRLAALEAELAAEGDYAQARLVKQRRDDIATLGRSAATGSGVFNVPLPAEAAKLVGVQVKNSELTGWHTATSAAEWTLPKLTIGTYRLELSYSMDDISSSSAGSSRQPAEEAEFNFREVTLLAGTTKNVLSFKIAGNKGVMTTVQVPGVLQLSHPPVTLRLNCPAYYPLNTIIFRDLRLIPVTPTTDIVAAAPAPVVTLKGEFQKLQNQEAERLLSIRKPLVTTYLEELAKLAPKAKDDAAEAIEAEQHRVGKLATNATLAKANSMGLDGYDDITDVHYVADPANTGDHFKVDHNGEQFRVRLAWVACPPVDADDKRTLKATTDHFGTDDSVALMIGSSAREFTELYLQARPLRLLVRTRQNKTKNDVPQALVFIEDIGLYQNVLIDNGFAIVDPPANPGRGLVETALLKSLQDREAAAKKHDPPQGGWALGTKGGTGGK